MKFQFGFYRSAPINLAQLLGKVYQINVILIKECSNFEIIPLSIYLPKEECGDNNKLIKKM